LILLPLEYLEAFIETKGETLTIALLQFLTAIGRSPFYVGVHPEGLSVYCFGYNKSGTFAITCSVEIGG
jgi:hypothetical protein